MKISVFLSIGLPVACILCTAACRNQAASADASEFSTFYERFLTDSIFQIEHIQFPLEGIPDNADSADVADGSFRWERETWKMHRKFDTQRTGFSIDLERLGSDIVTERILHESGRYAMLRRYAKMDGEWRLIYYAGLNSLAVPEE
ncbi:MAG: hypothetical protein HUU01_14865 [Saprospiraceae bacterium]|nr:hypothetical protein [Saprospiraceae bacterium]